jgi:hypothetical protein
MCGSANGVNFQNRRSKLIMTSHPSTWTSTAQTRMLEVLRALILEYGPITGLIQRLKETTMRQRVYESELQIP